ncbi:Opt2p [Sugiyamaella lignohabitans]|uniref:Opt2p n=1 Tax=Sugiyamaella lignohabitans TaxID=796027 RepID=A0A167E3S4_9ASCO|nr:Opt2p [Sugiyamaella lignohabitans]ANB13606.1 Opt2p [Sugiyamaella lignohabitans]
MPNNDEKIIETNSRLRCSFTDEQKAELAAKLGHGVTENHDISMGKDMDYMLSVIANLSESEAKKILQDAIIFHGEDPNFHQGTLDNIKRLVECDHESMKDDGLLYKMKMEAALIYYHSPYPEVRSVSDPLDDPELPVETFRSYVIGLVWVIIGVGVNQFFAPRQPPVSISTSLLQLLVYPCGQLVERLPDWGFTFRGKRYTINPGPWSYKEQILVTVMFSISGLAYINDQIFVQRLEMFYNNKWAGFGYQFTLLLSTQFLGFGLAGFVRHILIYPANCIWPAVFPTLALNRALLKPEQKELINGWSISRYKAFCISFITMFLYFWLPGYLFQALSTFNWITWISPNNYNLAVITGSITGLGVNPIPTFDWNIIDMSGPLFTPFFSYMNMYVGGLIGFLVLIPAIFYSNMYNTGYLPVNSNRIFTNTGASYDVKKILNHKGIADEALYQAYSPPYYTAGNLVTYGAFFAMYPAIIVDTILRRWNVLYDGFKTMYLAILAKSSLVHGYNDAHSRMMKEYKETPLWWYLAISIAALALAIACVEYYPTETPVWGIFFALGIGFVFLIPIGLLYATTNTLFSLNVFTELIAGYALPGKGIALMIIKAFGLNTNLQAISFIADQKLAHYAKIPPRATFRAQMIATFVSSIVSLGVANWQINNYEGICTPLQAQSK